VVIPVFYIDLSAFPSGTLALAGVASRQVLPAFRPSFHERTHPLVSNHLKNRQRTVFKVMLEYRGGVYIANSSHRRSLRFSATKPDVRHCYTRICGRPAVSPTIEPGW